MRGVFSLTLFNLYNRTNVWVQGVRGHRGRDPDSTAFDTHAAVTTLTAARGDPPPAVSVATQARDASVTCPELDAALSALEVRLVEWMIGALVAQTAALAAILRFIV